MFNQTIRQTMLTSDIANEVFPNIFGGRVFEDDSFVATLRAMLADRMPKDESITFSFRTIRRQVGYYDSVKQAVERNLGEAFMWVNSITLVNIPISDDGERSKWFTGIQQSVGQFWQDWVRVEKATLFFKKVFELHCYINPKTKSSVIIAENLDLRRYHYLQCGIFAFLPWYFDKERGATEEEMELINALRQKTSAAYEEIINKIAARYNFRELRIRRGLAGFETVQERQDLDRRVERLNSIRSDINSYQDAIAGLLRNMREEEIYIAGLQSRINKESSGEDSPIMNYFLLNERLVMEGLNGNRLTFGVKDYLTFFDEDIIKAMIGERDGILYRPNGRSCGNIIPDEDMELFYNAVFIDQSIRIRFCSVFTLTIGSQMTGNIHWNFGPEYGFYMPNPHIQLFSCTGNFNKAFNECIMAGNYIGAIEQAAASCRSLTVADYPVMQEFVRALYGIGDNGLNNRCVELPDGSVVTPKEAVAFLKGE